MLALMDEREHSEIPDGDLVLRYRSGDPTVLEVFYRRYCRLLYLYAFSITRDAVQSEDIVQEAFLKVLGRDPALTKESVKGLLCAAVRNLVRDDRRHAAVSRKHHPVLQGVKSGSSSEDPSETVKRMEALSWALDQLPSEQREAVILKVHADLTFSAIALLTSEPESTIKSRYRYAIQKLGELLANE